MEERKEYSVIGTVTIGSDEYKDLIEAKWRAESDKDRYMRQGWEKDSQINELKKQIETLSGQAEKYKNFIKSHCTINAEDSISLFVNLGE